MAFTDICPTGCWTTDDARDGDEGGARSGEGIGLRSGGIRNGS
jgi:hypothetical protein